MEDNLNLTAIRIREMRLENKWTQKDLANKLGLKNDTAIANYEAGYSMPKDDIKLKMCDIFNCTMDYLMGKSNIRNLEQSDIPEIRKLERGAKRMSQKQRENMVNMVMLAFEDAFKDDASKK